MASKKKEATTVWEYVDWLYCSGRLTAEEHFKLKEYVIRLEADAGIDSFNEGC